MRCGVMAAAMLLVVGITACTAERLPPADMDQAPDSAQTRTARATDSDAVAVGMPRSGGAGADIPSGYTAYQAAKAKLLPLLAHGSPRQQLAALLMQPDFTNDVWHQALVDLLLADGGRDPLLAGQALNACAIWKECPREQVLALTASLASEDARLQLLRLALSEPAQQESLWEAAVRAPVYVDPFEAQLEALLAATDPLATSTQNDRWRSVEAFGLTAATLGSDLRQLGDRCPPAASVNERVLQCRQLALLLAESPSVLPAQQGMAVLLRQALPAAEMARWSEPYRQLRWQVQLAMPLLDTEPMYPRYMAEHGERAAIAWLLRQRGLLLNPPSHWQPGQPTGY